MQIKIFTFPYSYELNSFDTKALDQFCLDKVIYNSQSHFFQHEGIPYWTVLVRYRIAGASSRSSHIQPPSLQLNERDKLLFERLRDWRSTKAQERGVPHFLVCKNEELLEIIRTRATTKAQLSAIHGFGPKKIKSYAEEIINIVQHFVASEPNPSHDQG